MRDWIKKVDSYCEKYNIPLFYLADTLLEPKVVPMIRGKAFEFTTMLALQAILPKDTWAVDKVAMNAQTGLHDVDVRVIHNKTKKIISVECKLAKKNGFRMFPDKHAEIRVKCMRSRTLGPAKVRELAPKLHVSERLLEVHNDQYLPTDFDVVITSIGNAFYRTDTSSGYFEWMPSKEEVAFLNGTTTKKIINLKDYAFNKLYIARSSSLTVSHQSGVICTRDRCPNHRNCGFIPDYPIIKFNKKSIPVNGWIEIEKSESLFSSFI